MQLFMALRLHGVVDTEHMTDMQTMNVVPQNWIVRVLAHHYHAVSTEERGEK